jgi:hypothetical protein
VGLLVGLQRQRTDARLAGFRTFPLITLLGALCANMAEKFGGWIVGVGLGALALIIVGGNLPLLRAGEERPGVTTEVTMLLMFALGAYVMVGTPAIAIATCGAVAVLLRAADAFAGARSASRLHRDDAFADLIDLRSPDRAYGPFRFSIPSRSG